VALRYAARLNGVTEIVLTLLDVLAGFDEIKVCTAYEIDGRQTTQFIPDACSLDAVTPIYESLPGFDDEITEARSITSLPANARTLVERIEDFVGVPISMVGVGPDREQTIMVKLGAGTVE